MVDQAPEFETIDALGRTVQYAGSVGTSPIQVPSSPGTSISEAFIRCVTDNSPNTKRLLWSIDNVTYHTLIPGDAFGWTFKKDSTNQDIKQLYVKGNAAGVNYEVTINFEEV
jgi:hypothetical protein